MTTQNHILKIELGSYNLSANFQLQVSVYNCCHNKTQILSKSPLIPFLKRGVNQTSFKHTKRKCGGKKYGVIVTVYCMDYIIITGVVLV